ncbi:MAG: polysaccharide biosynthesis/export family protein [Terriglobales bacterium]
MRRDLMTILILCAFGVAGPAQAPAPPSGPGAAVPASYVVGPNDVLAMTVFGEPELADSQMRVDADGTIHTPYGRTPVHVAGLTLGALAPVIAAELERDQLAVIPRVEVRVVDPESHPIVVSGLGVRRPGTVQAIVPMRLLDVLNAAGGLSGNSGERIVLVRPVAGGRPSEQQWPASAVLAATGTHDNPWLRGGEEVRVLPGGNAYVGGAVKAPGAIPLSDTDPLTVRKAIARAHGLDEAASAKRTQIIRHVGEPDQTTQTIDLAAVLDGRAPDIRLAANDMVYVPVSGKKRAGMSAISHTLTALTFAAGDLLIR